MDKKIVYVKIIVCPKCGGKGVAEVFNGDGYEEAEACDFCNEKRVVKQVVTIEYQEYDKGDKPKEAI